MKFRRRKTAATGGTSKYASADDFRREFESGMNGLYQLALLLAGDQKKAEQSLGAGIEDCVKSNQVFKGWARTWAKRCIVQNAIRELQPQAPQEPLTAQSEHTELPTVSNRDLAMERILELDDFERFVFVMTLLEGYSDRETALLLNSSIREVRSARLRVSGGDPLLLTSLTGCSDATNGWGE